MVGKALVCVLMAAFALVPDLPIHPRDPADAAFALLWILGWSAGVIHFLRQKDPRHGGT